MHPLPGLVPASHLLLTQLNFASVLFPGYLFLFRLPVHLGIVSSFTLRKIYLLLKDLSAVFHSLVPDSSLPGNPIDYLLEDVEVCFPKVEV